MIKKVKCKDDRDANNVLKVGQVYEVLEETRYYYCLSDVGGIWSKGRFIVMYDKTHSFHPLPGFLCVSNTVSRRIY